MIGASVLLSVVHTIDLAAGRGTDNGQDFRLRIERGRSLFARDWVAAPATTTLRDGLGPSFNARSCAACHGDRHRFIRQRSPDLPAAPAPSELVVHRPLVRAAKPGMPASQWHAQVVPGVTAPIGGKAFLRASSIGIGQVIVTWRSRIHTRPDSDPLELLWPEIRVVPRYSTGAPHRAADDGYAMATDVLSPRLAPALQVVAAIDRVSDAWIQAADDPWDHDGDGISGRANRVADARSGEIRIGRFGLRSTLPDLHHAVAAGLAADIGITNAWFPSCNHWRADTECGGLVDGSGPDDPHEIATDLVDDVVRFLRQMGDGHSHRDEVRALASVAASVDANEFRLPDPGQQLANASTGTNDTRGMHLFRTTGCAACHRIGPNGVRLYSNLLLHDMGEELADPATDDDQASREWRTAPLIGLSSRLRWPALLHDGRARSVEEAVAWHGGEAAASRRAFDVLSPADRERLVRHVESL